MTSLTPPPSPPMLAGDDPAPRRWTRDEFYRLANRGLFQGQRVELIEGEIMVFTPQNWPHASTVDRIAEVLRRSLSTGFWVRMQLPLNLSPLSDPEPDVSVVAGRREDYTDHPTAAVLIVEVSDTTLAYDRGQKASLYARAGIADYWIVNLVQQELEVYHDPFADASQPFGYRYDQRTIFYAGDHVTPLAAPQARILVADLLP
jgi:Uma2 family endonuclease